MPSTTEYLSKSDFLNYQTCPSYMWLCKYERELVPVDEEEVANQRRKQGDEVELEARKLFPNAHLITSKGHKAKAETEILVKDGHLQIFQATVMTDSGLLAMADLITFESNTNKWKLSEVKSTKKVKDKHIYDIAFQLVAFQDAGYDIGSVEIIHLNKTYKRYHVNDIDGMFVQKDVTNEVEKIIGDIRLQIKDALELMQRKDAPQKCSCRLKTKTNHCPTFAYLNKDVPEYSVFDIANIRSKKLGELIDLEVLDIREVPDDFKLSDNQRMQVNVAKTGNPSIDLKGIQKLLAEMEYPIYFLDYETVSFALPMYSGCAPYQQIPFQYSLDVIRSPGAKSEHYEFLAHDNDNCPAEQLLGMLRSHIGDEGSVVVWYQPFEKTRNSEMATMYLDYADFLLDVNDRIFDLRDFFSKQLYVHPKFMGSSSIKKVLPVLIPELSYKELGIQNGMVAPIRWYDAVNNNEDEEARTTTFNDLIKYCGLDTFAMVRIWEHLVEVGNE